MNKQRQLFVKCQWHRRPQESWKGLLKMAMALPRKEHLAVLIQLLVGNETEFLTLDFPAECRITVLLEDK